MAPIRIVYLSIATAVAYGLVHDQITVRICVEYFSVFHPPVFPTTSPTLLALGWGVLATWWVGAALGVVLATAARAGSLPALSARDLVRPLGRLLAVMAIGAIAAGLVGYAAARAGTLTLPIRIASQLAPEHHAALFADWWAHTASYAIGILGGVVLSIWVVLKRRALAVAW